VSGRTAASDEHLQAELAGGADLEDALGRLHPTYISTQHEIVNPCDGMYEHEERCAIFFDKMFFKKS
jgi:hypothetical protein